MKKIPAILTVFFLWSVTMSPSSKAAQPVTALFAGGCFWCMESDFEKLPGVVAVASGYTGGTLDNPTYEQVSRGGTGHFEAVRVSYDPEVIGYPSLLDYFFRHIDPLDATGQFCDKGSQYRAAVFYGDPQQREQAQAAKLRAESALGQAVVTQILPAERFYEAEEYHQDYYKKNPAKYEFYRWNCGRDRRIKEIWKGK